MSGAHKTNCSNLTFPKTTETTTHNLRFKGTLITRVFHLSSILHANNSSNYLNFCNYPACTLSINSYTEHRQTYTPL